MALVKCPRCGEEISSSSQNCIHCGAPVECCPECGNLVIAHSAACDRCGYSFAPQKKEEPAKAEKKVENVSYVITQFLDSEYGKTASRRQKLLFVIRLSICVIFIMVAFVVLMFSIEWKPELEDLVYLAEGKPVYSGMLNKMFAIFIVPSIILVIDKAVLQFIWDYLYVSNAKKFLDASGISSRDIMIALAVYDNIGELFTGKEKRARRAFIAVADAEVIPGQKKWYIVELVAGIIGNALTAVALVIMCNNVIEMVLWIRSGAIEGTAEYLEILKKLVLTASVLVPFILSCVILFAGYILKRKINSDMLVHAKQPAQDL